MGSCHGEQFLSSCQQGSDMSRSDASDGTEDRRKQARASAGGPGRRPLLRSGPVPCSHAAVLLLNDFLLREPGPPCSRQSSLVPGPLLAAAHTAPAAGRSPPQAHSTKTPRAPLLPFWGCSMSSTLVWGLSGDSLGLFHGRHERTVPTC